MKIHTSGSRNFTHRIPAHVDPNPHVVISDFEHSFIWHRNRQCRGPWACVLTRD